MLNGALASALGRPDLALNNAARPSTFQALPAGVNTFISPNAAGGFSPPVVALMLIIIGYAAFAYWVRPHLA